MAVIVLVALSILLTWLMHATNFGRLLHAVGDNPQAARLAGVPVARVRILAFVVSALSAVVAGILLGGFAGVSVDVGTGYELQAITACVLGGAVLLGGRGRVPETIAGALTLYAIFTLLNFLGLPQRGARGRAGADPDRGRRHGGHAAPRMTDAATLHPERRSAALGSEPKRKWRKT